MSAGRTARHFVPALRRLDGELALPLPARVSVLRELESDLEELTISLVARGHPPEVARGMALEALVPDGSTLGELQRVHAGTYARVTRRWGTMQLRALERSALAVATAAVVVFEALALRGTDLRRDPSPFLWPVLCLGAVLFAAVAAKAFSLWIKQEHRRPERGVGTILVLSGLVLAIGCVGAFVDFFLLVETLESAPNDAGPALLGWLRSDGVLLTLTMLTSMVGGLTWFILTQWLSALTAARHEVLGLRLTATTHGGR